MVCKKGLWGEDAPADDDDARGGGGKKDADEAVLADAAGARAGQAAGGVEGRQ